MSNSTSQTHHFHGNGTGSHNFSGGVGTGLSSGALTAILFVAGLCGGAIVGGIIFYVVRRVRRDRVRKRMEDTMAVAVGIAQTPGPPPPPKVPAKDVYGSRVATTGWNDPPPRMVQVSTPKGRMVGQEMVSNAGADYDFERGLHRKDDSMSSLSTAASSSVPLMASSTVHAERRNLHRPPGLDSLPERAPATSSSMRQRNVPSPRNAISTVTAATPPTPNNGLLSAPPRPDRPRESAMLSPAMASTAGIDPSPTSGWFASEESMQTQSRHESVGQSSVAEMTAMRWPAPPSVPVPPMPAPLTAPPPIPPLLAQRQPQGSMARPKTPASAKSKLDPSDARRAPSGYI